MLFFFKKKWIFLSTIVLINFSAFAQNKWSWISGYSVSDALWASPRPTPTPNNNISWPYQPFYLNDNFKPSVREHCGGGLIDNVALYVYGGVTLESTHASDFWMYDIPQNKWSIISLLGWGVSYSPIGLEDLGHPGGRNRMASAVDKKGNLWLFGGKYKNQVTGDEVVLSDLWKFNIKTNKWVFYGDFTNLGNGNTANNIPKYRYRTRAWFDDDDNLWIYGGAVGTNYRNSYNDLWKFNTQTLTWTFISGDKNISYAKHDLNGNYPATAGTGGTQYFPKARSDYGYWKDNSGNFWFFGGYAESHGADEFSDLWKFEPSTGIWTLVNGTNAMNVNRTTTNPGSRNAPYCWVGNDGHLYMYAGARIHQFLRDLWRFNTVTNIWEVVDYDTSSNQPPIITGYQTENTTNRPGSQVCNLSNITTGSHTYMYNGYGLGSNTQPQGSGPYNGFTGAVWRYSLDGYTTNNIPIAYNDSIKTYHKTEIALSILRNDDTKTIPILDKIDINTSLSGIQDTLSTSNGTFKINTFGVLVFKPSPAFVGTASLKYVFQNSLKNHSNNGEAKFIIIPANQQIAEFPIAINDTIKSPFQTNIYEQVLLNDFYKDKVNFPSVDIDTSKLGVQDSLITTHGRFKVKDNGVVEFKPVIGFLGSSSLGYAFQNTKGYISNVGKITFTVLSSSASSIDSPIANNDTTITNQNNTINYHILFNDNAKGEFNLKTLDIDESKIGIQDTLIINSGKLKIDSLGVLQYLFNNTITTDSINIGYSFKNKTNHLSNKGRFLFKVKAPNQALFPLAKTDTFMVSYNSIIPLDIFSNDSTLGNIKPLSIEIDTLASHYSSTNDTLFTQIGKLYINSSGIVVLQPIVGKYDTLTFYYKFKNNDNYQSNTAKVILILTECNTSNLTLISPMHNINVGGEVKYLTNGTITASNLISPNATKVEYFSKKSVLLSPGFETQINNVGRTFKIEITGCN